MQSKKNATPELLSDGLPDLLLIELYYNASFQTPFKMLAHVKVFQTFLLFNLPLNWENYSGFLYQLSGIISTAGVIEHHSIFHLCSYY